MICVKSSFRPLGEVALKMNNKPKSTICVTIPNLVEICHVVMAVLLDRRMMTNLVAGF
jgi:hypothetical protein